MTLELIFATSAAAFLLLYLAFNMDKQHTYLKLLLVGLFTFGLLLVAKAGLDSTSQCTVVVANETTVGNTTLKEYNNVCFEPAFNTGTSFYKFILWIVRLMYIYLACYIIWFVVIKPLVDLGKKRVFNR